MELKAVTIVGSEMVKPSQIQCLDEDHHRKLKLTPFDRAMAFIPYQQRILFYKPPNSSKQHFSEILQRLRQSLAEVLTVFYPLAGRISTDDEGRPVIDCGVGQSVRFVEAVTDSTIEELGDLFQPSDFCDSLCDLTPSFPWTRDDPLLLIKVTRFRCGGLGLGFVFNHQAMDGTSAWHFMNSWAEVARLGKVQEAPEIIYSFKPPKLTREEIEEEKQRVGLHLPGNGIVPKPHGLNLVTKVFNLGPDLIHRLKSEAAAATTGVNLSTFVVIGAYFWRRITLARRLGAEELTRFIVAVNCRERIPGLSKRYFGNAATAFAVGLKSGEITSNSGLASCSAVIQKGIRSCSGDNLAATMTYMECCLNDPEQAKSLNFWHNVVQPVGSHRHPVNGVDFGFGKPVGMTVGQGDLGDGKLYMISSPKEDGGLSVTVALPADVMGRLSLT